MAWRMIRLEEGSEVSPEDILPHFLAATADPTAVAMSGVRPTAAVRESVERLIKAILAREGLTALLFDGEADGWFPAMSAAVDIVLATGRSVFHIAAVPSGIAGLTAGLIGRSVGKAAAIGLLLRGTAGAGEMHKVGLVGRIIEPETLTDPTALLEGIFSGVDMGALTRLKKVWSAQEAEEPAAALAAERLEFQACFNEGAVESISDYLRTRIASK